MESLRFYKKTSRAGGWLGKIIAPLEKNLRSVKWGEYRLRDLFNHIEQGRRLKKSDQAKGVIPFVMSGTTHQGVVGYISNPVALFPANSITVDIFGNTFYRCYSFGAGDDTGVYWNDEIQYTEGTMLFIAAAISKLLDGKYSFGHKLRSSQSFDFVIQLPQTTDGNIDYAFMEDFVQEVKEMRLFELEKSHSNKLEAYLSEAGIKDCKLTDCEKEAINRVKNGKVRFIPVKIGDKLTGEKGDVDIQNKDINGRGLYFINSGVQNFGIKGMTDRKAKVFPKNTITIDFFGNAYYRPFNYVMATHNHVFSMSGDIIRNENIGLYLCASMSYLNKIYSYSNMGTWPIFMDSYIFLPTHPGDGQIDFDFMNTYINAIKKQCVANLKREIVREHKAYEQVMMGHAIGRETIELNPHDSHYSEKYYEPLMAAEPFECYKWEGFDQSICDFIGGDKTILIGCYKGKKYQDWIHTHNIYTIRLGDTKGSMEANRELFDSTSLLVLYELGKPNKLSAYKIVGNKEMGKEELLAMDYPNKKPRKSYMTFSITPFEMDLTFLAEHHLIERIIELNSDNAKGTPVFIQP